MRPSSLLALLLAGVLFACGEDSNEIPNAIFVSGRIEGDESRIAPKQPGRILEVTVREGDSAEAGQTLVRLSAEQTEAQRAEAEAAVESARRRVESARLRISVLEQGLEQASIQEQQAETDAAGRVAQAEGQLAAAEAELARARAEYEQNLSDARRYGQLAEAGAASGEVAQRYKTASAMSEALVDAAERRVAAAQGALETAKSSLQNPRIRSVERASLRQQIAEARAQVRTAEAEVDRQQAALSRIQADLDDLTVEAPFDGVVITRLVEPGQVVTAGTPLLTLLDLSELYLRGFVPEGQIGFVEVGQQAEVFLDSQPETAIPAEVMRVDPEAMFTPENIYFREDRVTQVVGVKLRILGALRQAKPGMPADGRILINPQAAEEAE